MRMKKAVRKRESQKQGQEDLTQVLTKHQLLASYPKRAFTTQKEFQCFRLSLDRDEEMSLIVYSTKTNKVRWRGSIYNYMTAYAKKTPLSANMAIISPLFAHPLTLKKSMEHLVLFPFAQREYEQRMSRSK